MTTAEGVARREGGRSALVLAAVRSAVTELTAERGAAQLTVPAIAERANVSASSIYRRWGDLPTLLAEVATYRLDPDRPLPDTGDLRSDLLGWARELVEHLGRPSNAAMLRAGAALAGDGESDCLRNRRAEATRLVERVAAASSGPVPDVPEVIDHVVAPIVYRVIFDPGSLDDAVAERLVDGLLAALPAGD
ncbi:TetR/AcrR family transcriptional regulator [Plantactinospora siamensis]|uniref:TetR/AcrR family transcriptional regulator n=1 Tax=Plantactinospora siamensis TaxID=555372 RepID=A0ABV6P4N7_9ACTN